MRIRKVKVTKEKLDNLVFALHNIPTAIMGDHLTDDEFIRYVREELSEEESDRIDTHLESCDECATEAERLTEGSNAWYGEQGKKRLAAFRSRCLFARTLSQAAKDFSQFELLVADDGSTRKIWDWHNDMISVNISISIIQDANDNWIFLFSSKDMSLQDKKFSLNIVSLKYEVVLRKVSQDEIGAKVVVPNYARPQSIKSIMGISFDIDKASFAVQNE